MCRSSSPRFGDLVFLRCSRDELSGAFIRRGILAREDEFRGAHEPQRGGSTPMGQARWAREVWLLVAGCEQDA